MTPPVPALARLAVGLAGLLAASLAVAPGMASAHDDTGSLTVASTAPGGPGAITYVVDVTYANDGHGAAGATVTVVAEGADGALVGPVPLTPAGEDGRYQATVQFPTGGPWALRFTSLSPLAVAELLQEVDPGPGSTAPTTGTTPTSGTASPPGPTVPAAASAAGGDEGGEDGSSVGLLLLLLGAVAALAALAVGLVLRHGGAPRT